MNGSSKRRGETTKRVLEQLRLDLIANKFDVREKIVEQNLAGLYGVSRGSVRAALSVLEGEGLIRTLANGTKQVLEVTEEYISDIFDIRKLLECRANEIIINKKIINYEPMLQVLSSLHKYENSDANNKDYSQLDIDFHRALIIVSGNRALLQTWEVTSQLMLSLLTYNADESYVKEYVETFYRKHQTIIDMLITRNPEIIEFTIDHIEMGKDLALKKIRESHKSVMNEERNAL